LLTDLNISIPIHNHCPISVLRDYQCNVNFSYHIGLEPMTFSDIPCVSIDQHLLGIHMLPNRRKTSTQIPCKDNQLSRVSTILTSFVYHAMWDVSSKMISAAPVRGMLASYPSHFPWRGQIANQPHNLSRIAGRWQSD
jgi:hypothetical protein